MKNPIRSVMCLMVWSAGIENVMFYTVLSQLSTLEPDICVSTRRRSEC